MREEVEMDRQERWRLAGLLLLFLVWLGIAWSLDSSVNRKKSYTDTSGITASSAVVQAAVRQEQERLKRVQEFQDSLDRSLDEILESEEAAEQLRRQNQILSDILLEMRYQEMTRQFEYMEAQRKWRKSGTQTLDTDWSLPPTTERSRSR